MMKSPFSVVLAVPLLWIAGCGGSGGGTSSASSTLTINGVAATGAALTSAVVTAQCASGTGTATQSAGTTDGSFTVTITGGTLPCVLTAAGKNSAGQTVTLHSVTTTATANVTPLTELLLAQLTGQDPSAYVASLDPSTLSSTVTANSLSSAQSAVVTTLTNAGIPTADIPTNLVTSPITAGSGTGYDKALDNLATSLSASGSTLNDVAKAVASTALAAKSTSPSANASPTLPADLLLKPQASNCSALRSTNYWIVLSARHGSNAVAHVAVNATALTITDLGDQSVEQLTPNGTCRYSTTSGHDILISQAGVLVSRSKGGSIDPANSYHLAVGVPEQTHTVAELAGVWNMIGTDSSDGGTTWFAFYGAQSIDANGSSQILTGSCSYDGLTSTSPPNCLTTSKPGSITTVNGARGFTGTAIAPSVYVERSFAYRAGNGEMFIIDANQSTSGAVDGDGSIAFLTKQRTVGLPAVNSVSALLNVSITTLDQLSASAIATTPTTHTIQSLDSTNGKFTRQSGLAGGVTHPETFTINTPLLGFTMRDAASVTQSDNTSLNVRALLSLRLPGMGLSLNYQPATNIAGGTFLVSVLQ